MSHEELIEKLHAIVCEFGTQKAFAEHLGISRPYLNDILQGKREPCKKTLAYLGMERVTIYRGIAGSRKGGR